MEHETRRDDVVILDEVTLSVHGPRQVDPATMHRVDAALRAGADTAQTMLAEHGLSVSSDVVQGADETS